MPMPVCHWPRTKRFNPQACHYLRGISDSPLQRQSPKTPQTYLLVRYFRTPAPRNRWQVRTGHCVSKWSDNNLVSGMLRSAAFHGHVLRAPSSQGTQPAPLQFLFLYFIQQLLLLSNLRNFYFIFLQRRKKKYIYIFRNTLSSGGGKRKKQKKEYHFPALIHTFSV